MGLAGGCSIAGRILENIVLRTAIFFAKYATAQNSSPRVLRSWSILPDIYYSAQREPTPIAVVYRRVVVSNCRIAVLPPSLADYYTFVHNNFWPPPHSIHWQFRKR